MLLINVYVKNYDYFKNKDEYQEKGNQITKAIYLYFEEEYNQDRHPLLKYKEMDTIIKNYNEKLKIKKTIF